MSKQTHPSREPQLTRRVWRLLGLIVMAFCVGLAAMPADAAPGSRMLSVAAQEANFRKGPSTRHEIAFTAIRNFPVKELKRSKGWVLIEDFEGEQAWVAARLLHAKPSVIISVNRANVRAKPSTKAEVVDKAARGEVYRVVGGRGKWIKLAAGDDPRGWLHGDLAWGATE